MWKTLSSLLKRYCKRLPKLENLTLADWAAGYDYCSSKPYVKKPHEIDIDGRPLEKYIDDEQNDDDDEFVKTTNSKTRRRSKARVLRSVWFNKQKEPEKHHRELLMLFTPWRNEETDLLGNFASYLSDDLGIPSVDNSEPLTMNELPDDE